MPDKLTDNEIIKALKELLEIMLCEGDLQRSATISKALDLINRLQAEKQNLEIELKAMRGAANSYKAENERLKNLTLEKCCDNCIHEEKTLQASPCCECFGHRNFVPKNLLKLIKAEARKEFAERLKEIMCQDNEIYIACAKNMLSKDFQRGYEEKYDDVIKHIDNLSKEMESEKLW